MNLAFLDFSASTTKVIRAGWANLLWPIMAVGGVFIYLAMRDFGVSLHFRLIAVTTLICFLFWQYTRALARITCENGVLSFDCALHRVTIKNRDITKTKIFALRPYRQIVFLLFVQDRFFPHIFVATRVWWVFGDMITARDEARKLIEGCK